MVHPVHCVCCSRYMLNMMNFLLSIDTCSWHGDIERDNETFASAMIVHWLHKKA